MKIRGSIRDSKMRQNMNLQGITIEWAENPLASKVTLDDYGVLRLKYAMAIDGLLDAGVLINMDSGATSPPTKGGKWVDHFEYIGHLDNIDTEIERRLKSWYLSGLTEAHCGDCTCVPMSCSKCAVEEFLDISTTDGLNKHSGHHMAKAFSGGRTTCALALNYMKTAPITATWDGWEVYLPRWTQERNEAIAWLETYAKDHGFNVDL